MPVADPADNLSAYVKSCYQFELRESLTPLPGPGQLQVRVAACGICGTDLHIADRTADDWQPFGHEAAGLVTAIGEGVTRFAVGDRVAMDSSAPCGKCDACLPAPAGRNRPDLCPQPVSYWGWPTMGFSRALITPQECAVKIPDGIPYDIACLVEPLGVSIDLVRTAQVAVGDHVLVLGPGPLGLGAIAVAKLAGAERILVAGRSHSLARLRAAEALGADCVIDLDKTPLDKYDFGSRKPDKILVTSPPPTLPGAISAAAYGGTIAYVGIAYSPDTWIRVDADALHFNKNSLRASHASPGVHARQAIRLLATVPVIGREMISHRFALTEIASAMNQARADRTTVKKMVMVSE